MGLIRELDSDTVVKIAAGEVIERPASLVRELIDNAVDAGATHIVVRTASGGKTYVEVCDNGKGMDADDLRLCVKNHSTSKIREFNDISALNTLGFRGEALASIAGVANLTIRSREPQALSGHILTAASGGEISIAESGMNAGTTVIVKNLFENIPVRRKFLSTDAVETRYIDREIQKKALAFHEIGFEFVVDGTRKYIAPARNTLRERVADFYPDLANEVIPLESKGDVLAVTGFVTKPAFIRKNRLYQHFFVNRRYIEWKPFNFLVSRIYGNLIPEGFFPGAFVYLDIPPESVDFNVHPMKKEARFEREQDVSKFVEHAIKSVLLEEQTPRLHDEAAVEFTPYERRIARAISGFFEKRDSAREEAPSLDFSAPSQTVRETPAESGSDDIGPIAESPARETFAEPEGLRYVGAAFRTYLLFESEERLLFVDQHAAHERINYERLRKNRETSVEPQEYLIPLNFDVPLNVVDTLESKLDELAATGFEVEHFGGTTFVIRAGPAFVEYETSAEVVLGFAEALMENDRKSGADFVDEALKQMACKASVRAGDNLSREEAYELIAELFKSERPYSCPHGRPIIYSIERKDVDKNFKRLGF